MKKSNTSPQKTKSLAMVIAVLMLGVFVIQMVFPTNLGKVFTDNASGAMEMTVTKAGGEVEAKSYFTDDIEKMDALVKWASEKKMRNRSLADSVHSGMKTQMEYTFAIKLPGGTYTSIVIDERGFIHFGAELYSFTGDKEQVLSELEANLESWSEEE